VIVDKHIASEYGVPVSLVRRLRVKAKRENRRLTDSDFLDDLSTPSKPLGDEAHAQIAELIVALENLQSLLTLRSFGGTATGKRCFAAWEKGLGLRRKRENSGKGKNRRGKLPKIELEVAPDGSDAELVRLFFWLGFGLKPKKSGPKGGRPRTTSTDVVKTLRTKTARRVKDSPVTKNGGWVASRENSARERARKTVRKLV
jgi:hypothetical protein